MSGADQITDMICWDNKIQRKHFLFKTTVGVLAFTNDIVNYQPNSGKFSGETKP